MQLSAYPAAANFPYPPPAALAAMAAPQLALSPRGSLAYTFVDEEELLGFKIWVAELELLVGNARGRTKPDQVQCFQLLQKLVVALDRSTRPEVKEYQRRCEEAVVDILLKGAPPPVRLPVVKCKGSCGC